MISTELICSKEYILRLNPNFFEKDWLNLIERAKAFEPIYKKKMPYILKFIPLYTGVEWDQFLNIPIYLADYPSPSRTNPLTIKIGSPKDMLVKLIHELTHLNFPPFDNIPIEIYEDAINQVTKKIADRISVKNCSALEKIVEYRIEIKKRGFLSKIIDLHGTNLKKYFNV